MPTWFPKIICRIFSSSKKATYKKLIKISIQISRKSLGIYKIQLKFFRKTRLENGIKKVNPRKIVIKTNNAACPKCSNSLNGPLCKSHDKQRFYLFKRAIAANLMEPSHTSVLIAKLLSTQWISSSLSIQNNELKNCLKLIRSVSVLSNTDIADIKVNTIKRLKHQLDDNSWKDTNIGNLDDFFSVNITRKIDIPFYYVRRKSLNGSFLDIGFPLLFKWEIKCLLSQTNTILNIRQMKYLNDRLIPYLMINPVRLVKGKETYTNHDEILKRTIWFETKVNNSVVLRILSCSHFTDTDNFIFEDGVHGDYPKIIRKISKPELRNFGFIYVGK